MSRSIRTIAGLGLSAFLGLTLAAQGSALRLAALPAHLGWKYATAQFRERGQFRLAILAPCTGPEAKAGEEIKHGVSLAFEAVHWRIGKYTIVPVWIDSRPGPAKAAQSYETAILQDHVQAGLQILDRPAALAVMEVTARHQVPHFLGAAACGGRTEGAVLAPAFTAAYQAAFGCAPDPATAGSGYDSAQVFIKMANEIISQGDELTSESIYRFVKDQTATGKTTFVGGPAAQGGTYNFPLFPYRGEKQP